MSGFRPHHNGTERLRSMMYSALIALSFFIGHLNAPSRVYAQPAAYLHSLEKEIVSLVKQVEPAVVSVIVQRKFNHSVNGQTFTDWERSVGTGVVVHRDGYIITTAGLVDHAHDILTNFQDGRYRLGKLVGVDPLSNIAVIQVDSVSVRSARLADSDNASPGSWVLVMNNARGFPPMMTTGIVNGVREEDVMMQVSAVAGGDFTGGAVFSSNGRLLGLVAGPQGSRPSVLGGVREADRAGVISVIPINRVKTLAGQLIESGEIRRSWLGVFVEKIWDSVSVGNNRSITLGTGNGMVVSDVYPDSPAMRVGLRKGDILLSVNGVPMSHPIILAEFVTTLPAGSRIEIKYLREEKEHVVQTVLAPQPKKLRSPAAYPAVGEESEDPLAREDPVLIQQLIMEHEQELAAHRIKLNQLKRLLDQHLRLATPRSAIPPGPSDEDGL